MVCATLALTGLGSGSASATQAPGANAYQAVVERNVFALKPPTPAPPPEITAPPLPKLFLQGITTILGVKKALIKVQAQPQPGAAAKGEGSLILGEGQREGGVTVLQIDETAGRVKVDNFGTLMEIDFEHNGVAAAPAPAQVASAASPSPVNYLPAPRQNSFTPRFPPSPVPAASFRPQ